MQCSSTLQPNFTAIKCKPRAYELHQSAHNSTALPPTDVPANRPLSQGAPPVHPTLAHGQARMISSLSLVASCHAHVAVTLDGQPAGTMTASARLSAAYSQLYKPTQRRPLRSSAWHLLPQAGAPPGRRAVSQELRLLRSARPRMRHLQPLAPPRASGGPFTPRCPHWTHPMHLVRHTPGGIRRCATVRARQRLKTNPHACAPGVPWACPQRIAPHPDSRTGSRCLHSPAAHSTYATITTQRWTSLLLPGDLAPHYPCRRGRVPSPSLHSRRRHTHTRTRCTLWAPAAPPCRPQHCLPLEPRQAAPDTETHSCVVPAPPAPPPAIAPCRSPLRSRAARGLGAGTTAA